jgi:hypothetical protein
LFALILYQMFVDVPAFDAALSLCVLMSQVTSRVRRPLPEPMAAAVADIIRQGRSVDAAAPRSFEDFFDALRRIEFKMTQAVDRHNVSEFVTLVDPSAARKPAQQPPQLMSSAPAKQPRRQLPPRGNLRAARDPQT